MDEAEENIPLNNTEQRRENYNTEPEVDQLDKIYQESVRSGGNSISSSKKSYIISELKNGSSKKKSETSTGGRKVINFNKLKYHNKAQDNHCRVNSVKSIHSPHKQQRINLSPNYKRKLNFSHLDNANTGYNKHFLSEGNVQQKHNKPGSGYDSTRAASTVDYEGKKFATEKTIINFSSPTGRSPQHIQKASAISQYSQRIQYSGAKECYLQTIYNQSECSKSSSISSIYFPLIILESEAKRLHEWLTSIDLQSYYGNFLEHGLVNIDKLIENTEQGHPVSYEMLQEIGIKKPGHIYRILVKLELDAKMIDDYIAGLLLGSEALTKKPSTMLSMKMSMEKNVCCGIWETTKVSSSTKQVSFDLISWLKLCKVPHLRKNFLHNGFESINFLLLQMFSSFALDDCLLEDNLHIYNKSERKLILSQLLKDVKKIKVQAANLQNSLFFSSLRGDSMMESTEVEAGCQMCNIF